MIQSFTIRLYRHLYENGDMDLYQWHQDTCISPIELANIVNKEIKEGRIILSADKSRISITDFGKKWLEVNKLELFAEEKEQPWRYVPDDMNYSGDKLFDSLFDTNDLQKLIDNLEY